MSKNIPISKAKEISKEYEFDMVVVIGINYNTSGHITTYGKDKSFCNLAEWIGKQLSKFLFVAKSPFRTMTSTEIKKIMNKE